MDLLVVDRSDPRACLCGIAIKLQQGGVDPFAPKARRRQMRFDHPQPTAKTAIRPKPHADLQRNLPVGGISKGSLAMRRREHPVWRHQRTAADIDLGPLLTGKAAGTADRHIGAERSSIGGVPVDDRLRRTPRSKENENQQDGRR